jgi:hypothetical protein
MSTQDSTAPNRWPAYVTAGLLLIALGDQASGYYIFLRWVVMFVGIYYAYTLGPRHEYRAGLFGVLAVLFNPVFMFTFSKGTWQIIDLVAAGVFAFAINVEQKAGYKIKPDRLTADLSEADSMKEMEKIIHEYGKVVVDVMSEGRKRYPAFVFPVSMLPASKAEIGEAYEEGIRQAQESGNTDMESSLSGSLAFLDQFINDEDAQRQNRTRRKLIDSHAANKI